MQLYALVGLNCGRPMLTKQSATAVAKAPLALKTLRQAVAVTEATGYGMVGVRFSELHWLGMLAQQYSGR